MLKHGGLSSKYLYVTFAKEVNEPSHFLPKLAKDTSILRVRKQEVNNHTKDFNVRRANVQQPLLQLKNENEASSDICDRGFSLQFAFPSITRLVGWGILLFWQCFC